MFGTACRPCIQVSILRHKRTSQFNIADSFEGTVSQIRNDVTRCGLSDEIRSSHTFSRFLLTAPPRNVGRCARLDDGDPAVRRGP